MFTTRCCYPEKCGSLEVDNIIQKQMYLPVDASYFFYSLKLTKIPNETNKNRITNLGPEYKEKYK